MSGVYIKGMGMPTRCAECWIMELDGWCWARGRDLPQEYRRGIKDRPDWCPLVPVPPHGRLLDEEVIKAHSEPVKDHAGRVEEIIQMRFLGRIPTVIPAEEGESGRELSTEWYCVEDMVENAPTIIEAEGE